MKRINLIKFPAHSWGRFSWKVNNVGAVLYKLSRPRAYGNRNFSDKLFGWSTFMILNEDGEEEEDFKMSATVTTKNVVVQDLKRFLRPRR